MSRIMTLKCLKPPTSINAPSPHPTYAHTGKNSNKTPIDYPSITPHNNQSTPSTLDQKAYPSKTHNVKKSPPTSPAQKHQSPNLTNQPATTNSSSTKMYFACYSRLALGIALPSLALYLTPRTAPEETENIITRARGKGWVGREPAIASASACNARG